MTRTELVAAILLSVAAVTIFNILPLFLGAAAEELSLAPDKIGFLAGIETVAIALASLVGPIWIKRINWRNMAFAATLFIVFGNLFTMATQSYNELLLARALTGFFGEGTAYALALVAIGKFKDPDRAFGFSIIAQVIAGAIGLIVLPGLTVDWGMNAALVFLACIGLMVLPVLRWMPQGSPIEAVTESKGRVFPIYIPLIGLLVQAIWYLNVGAFWPFVERIANDAGLAAQTIGTSLSIGMVAGLAGAVLAAWLSYRLGRVWPFCLTLVVHGAIMFSLGGDLDGTRLTLVMIFYNMSWNFGMAYLLGLIATSDSSGKMLILIPVAQAMGVGGGPVIAGVLATQYGFSAVTLFAAICCVVSFLIFVPFALIVTGSKWRIISPGK